MGASELERLAERELSAVTRYRFTRADDLVRELPPTRWLLHRMFEEGAFGMLFGEPATCKSFVGLDWCLRIATGTDWCGRRVSQGPAVYLTGEGREGIRRRVAAWFIRNRIDPAGVPFFRSDFVADLSDIGTAEAVGAAVADLCANPRLIVVDTVARHLGGDENSTQDVARFVQHLDAMVREPTGAAILLIHHSGHGDKNRARGSSVLKAAVDHEFRMSRTADGLLVLHNPKQKDGAEQPDMAFRLATVELPIVGEDGRPETSAVLDPADLPEQTSTPSLGTNQRKALATLQTMQREHRQRLADAGRDPDTARVLIEDWRSALDLDRFRWREVRDGLAAKGLVRLHPPYAEACE